MSDLNRQQLQKAPKERRDGPLQAEIIPMLLSGIPGCQTMRWRENTFKAFAGTSGVVHEEDDFRSALNDLEVIPDAYVIYPDTMELHFFEVEIRHLLTDSKMESYAKFVTDMDYYGIKFSLFSVNQHCHVNEVLLLAHYLKWLKKAEAEAA